MSGFDISKALRHARAKHAILGNRLGGQGSYQASPLPGGKSGFHVGVDTSPIHHPTKQPIDADWILHVESNHSCGAAEIFGKSGKVGTSEADGLTITWHETRSEALKAIGVGKRSRTYAFLNKLLAQLPA